MVKIACFFLSYREGSQSPTTRKRKRFRRGSLGEDSTIEMQDASNSSDMPQQMGVPALGITPVADEKVHADSTDSLGRSALMTQLTKPADEMLQVKCCEFFCFSFFLIHACQRSSRGCRQKRCFFRFVGKEKFVLCPTALVIYIAVWKRCETCFFFLSLCCDLISYVKGFFRYPRLLIRFNIL